MRNIILTVIFLLISSMGHSQIYSADIAFLTYVKCSKSQLTHELTDGFLRSHYYDEYIDNSSDEFSKKEYIDGKYVEFKNSIDTLNVANQYWIPVMIRLGKYDFELKRFPVIYDDDLSDGEINRPGVSKFSYIGKAENMSKFKYLHIEPDKAKELVDKLKAIGNTERQALCFAFFTFNGNTTLSVNNDGDNIASALCNIDLIQIRTRDVDLIDIK